MTSAAAIPSHWQSGNIRRFAQMKTGHTPSRSVPEYWESAEIPWFTLADVWQLRDGRQTYLGETENKINELGLANSAAELLPAGTVVLSRTASVGFSGIMPRPMATSQDFWNWVCGPTLLPEYLNYQFKSMAAEFKSLNMGSTHQTIYQKDAAALQIVVPPLDEQRAIADYLDRETARVDTLIEEQQRLIEMLRERRAAVISSALAPTNSWVRRRVKHIGETSLGKMLDAGRSVRAGERPRPYVRAADIRADGSVNLLSLNEMPFSDAEMEMFDLRAGDVLLIEGGATVGRPGFMFESAPGIAFQKTVNRLRVGPQTNARFVYWSMLRLYESAYYVNHYGSVSFVHLTGEKLREIELHLPPFQEQRAIAAYLDEETTKIDTLVAETVQFIELSKERRAALITAAVTGQIDVREMA
ncbi:restriction endonuclease subunit S [Amycolatopsis sp. NPDC049691]|uniref:restriction endonuclease subunit S n=1 Tax=Amycolatopsis sp. NPDC049691 TaxID=3155155 RepID=UPI00341FFA71